MKKFRNIVVYRQIAFCVIAVIILNVLNFIFRPIWLDWNNYDTIEGFYEQPDDTIETVFLGASIAVNGFTPMELYENYGICAWNLSTEQQPVLASYYWMIETYQHHSGTLKTVVIDTSMLRNIPSESFYQKALQGMRFSINKCQAVRDCTDTLDDFISYFVPIFSYHTRWKELDALDFEIIDYEINTSVRGYNFNTDRVIDEYDEFNVPAYIEDNGSDKLEFQDEALLYLKKMIAFCQEKDLKLILTKTPGSNNWSDSAHIAVQSIADEYGLEFFDFNYSPYILEMGYNEMADSVDMVHMNYYGATKLTCWFGEYLTKNCAATDVRGIKEFDFLEKEVSEYREHILPIALSRIVDPVEYIETVNRYEQFTLFLSVKDEGSNSLTKSQRDDFKNMGLVGLSNLLYRDSYLAVMEGGEIIYEKLQHNNVETNKENDDIFEDINDLNRIEEFVEHRLLSENLVDDVQVSYLEIAGITMDGTTYELCSGGNLMGNISSCVLDDVEYSKNKRGINIVVYDNKNGKVVDSVVFDTYLESIRVSGDLEYALQKELDAGTVLSDMSEQLKALHLYNCRCTDSLKVKELRNQIEQTNGTGFMQYLDSFLNDKNYVIFLSVQGNVADMFDSKARSLLAKYGLAKLCDIEAEELYLAVIEGGNVIVEEKDEGKDLIDAEGINFKIVSGDDNSGNVSSIVINNREYSPGEEGINVVVYNRITEEVADAATFSGNN